MKRYRLNELLKKLEINKTTFYKYYANSKDILDKKRYKEKNGFSYDDNFITLYRSLMNQDLQSSPNTDGQQDEHRTTSEQQPQKNELLDELKNQYEERIKDLKGLLENSQNQFSEQLSKNSTQTDKIETLLIQLLKVTKESNMIENKTETKEEDVKVEKIDPEKVIKEVKQTIEKNKQAKEEKLLESEILKLQLERANNQAKEYNKFKKEKDSLIENLKKEYNRTKFFQILKKSKLKKDIEKAYSKQFEFVHYVV